MFQEWGSLSRSMFDCFLWVVNVIFYQFILPNNLMIVMIIMTIYHKEYIFYQLQYLEFINMVVLLKYGYPYLARYSVRAVRQI